MNLLVFRIGFNCYQKIIGVNVLKNEGNEQPLGKLFSFLSSCWCALVFIVYFRVYNHILHAFPITSDIVYLLILDTHAMGITQVHTKELLYASTNNELSKWHYKLNLLAIYQNSKFCSSFCRKHFLYSSFLLRVLGRRNRVSTNLNM